MIFIITGLITTFIILGLFAGLSSRDRSVILQPHKTFVHDTTERSYLISLPSNVTEDSRLIFGFHGYGDSARRFAYYTGLHNAATDNDIVVYPQAIEPSSNQRTGWNAGFCCGSGWKQDTDDIGFIVSLADSLIEQYQLNSDQFYTTGFSNGSFFSQRLAIDVPDRVAAVGASSGSIGTTENRLTPAQAVPILLLHGEKDQTVPFNGGIKSGDPDFDWLPFSATLDTWKTTNNDEALTESIVYPEDGHVWHDWRILNFWHRQPKASLEIVKFFDSL